MTFHDARAFVMVSSHAHMSNEPNTRYSTTEAPASVLSYTYLYRIGTGTQYCTSTTVLVLVRIRTGTNQVYYYDSYQMCIPVQYGSSTIANARLPQPVSRKPHGQIPVSK